VGDSDNPLFEIISELVPAQETITGDLRFSDLAGWSSITALDLLVSLETRLEIQLDLRCFLTCETVGELTALVGASNPPASRRS